MSDRTWADNLKFLHSLWPAWKATTEQVAVWDARLGKQRRQDWLREAIESHYAESERRREPDMRDILDRYSAIAQSGEVRGDCRESGGAWRALWTEERNGHRYQMASAETYDTPVEAFRAAMARGTDPDSFRVGGSGLGQDSYEQRETALEASRIAATLSGWPRDRLAAAIDLGRSKGLIREGPIPRSVLDWPAALVFAVHEIDARKSAATA